MSVTNYSSLVSAVQEALEDDSEETLDYIPTAVEMAEFRLLRETDFTGIDSTAIVSATAGNRLMTKPTGYRLGKSVRYATSNGELRNVIKNTVSFCEKYWPYANTSTAQPKYYSDYSVTQFLLSPTPDADYAFLVAHVVKPQGVSAGNETNTYTQWMPDALFHATMSEMSDYARNGELKQYHETSYVNVLTGVNNEARRARADEGMSPLNLNVQVNTLKREN